MATSWRSADVVCPFYLEDQGLKITCEGFTDGSTISQQFRKRDDYKRQMDLFCCGRCEYCELYRMLAAEKYGE